jgi:hypothetical protein
MRNGMKNIKNITLKLSVAAIIVVAVGACDFFEDLDVQNLNNPDKERLLADPAEYPSIIGGAYSSWWSTSQKSDPQWALTVAAQVMTSSWGNWAAWDVGRIPSEPIQNSQTYVYRPFYETPWYGYNGVLASVNDVMELVINGGNNVIDGGVDKTPMVVANGKIVQGLALGHLGLLFDQAFVADENSDLGTLTFSSYQDVIDAAIEKFDEGIAIANANTFENPAAWIPGYAFTNQQLVKFASTMAARTLAYSARTKAETEALNWGKILTYANNGIDFDFAPNGDGGILWWDRIKIQGQDAVWARVSQRVIRSMASNPADPGAVYPWPDGVASLPAITTDDARVASDFQYIGATSFNATRGYYFFGAYRYKRFDSYRASFTGPMMAVPLIENNLLRAEALIRTGGSKTTAAELINASRVTRGNLAALTGSETNQAMLDAIMYERYVELGWGHASTVFYDRRRTDDLESNRFTQLPVPARELNVLNLPVYTFGGGE